MRLPQASLSTCYHVLSDLKHKLHKTEAEKGSLQDVSIETRRTTLADTVTSVYFEQQSKRYIFLGALSQNCQ